MPVPASIDDLSTTASSNSPSGSETPTEGDNYLRAAFAFIAQLRDQNATASAVIAYRSGIISLSAGTNTIRFDTTSLDRLSDYDVGTGIFTAPTTGLYQVNCSLQVVNGSLTPLTFTGAYISKNNSSTFPSYLKLVWSDVDGATIGAGSNEITLNGSCLFSLTAGDTLRVVEVHSGSLLTVNAGSSFSIAFIG